MSRGCKSVVVVVVVVVGYIVDCKLEGFDRAVVGDVVWATHSLGVAGQKCSCWIGGLNRKGCGSWFEHPTFLVGGRRVEPVVSSSGWEGRKNDLLG